MKIRLIAASLICLTLGLAMYWLPGHGFAQSGQLPACPNGVAITQPFSGSTVGGITTLEATIPASYGAQSVSFILNGNQVYSALPVTPYWRYSLDTRTLGGGSNGGNGTYALTAQVTMTGTGNTAFTCATPAIGFSVQNSTTTQPTGSTDLLVVASVTQWTGPTNAPFDIVVKAGQTSGGTTSDVTQQASYVWSTTRGSLTPHGSYASANSGPETGNGSISVVVRYGNLSKTIAIPISVLPYTSTSAYPVTGSTGQPAAGTGVTGAQSPSDALGSQLSQLFATAQNTAGQGDAELDRCLSFYRVQQQSRLTFDELQKTDQCFARRSSVVPANLAPVAPQKVSQLPVSKTARVDKLATVQTGAGDGLRISGTAPPKSTVVIYLFSEPLVLVAKADSQGQWSYTLQDPMEPGKHQAYVTVEGDSSATPTVRSPAYNFAVAEGAKSSLNPHGLSLTLSKTPRSTLFYTAYIGGAVLMVLLAVGGGWWYLRRRTRSRPASSTEPTIKVG